MLCCNLAGEVKIKNEKIITDIQVELEIWQSEIQFTSFVAFHILFSSTLPYPRRSLFFCFLLSGKQMSSNVFVVQFWILLSACSHWKNPQLCWCEQHCKRFIGQRLWYMRNDSEPPSGLPKTNMTNMWIRVFIKNGKAEHFGGVFCIIFSERVSVAGLLHHVRLNLTAELRLTHTAGLRRLL